ncbi:tautomerase family protein [Pseudonocardia spinosispora]|uniref:tautomerase family protein n=1 Tax=Pseudonocardia spinosispora TaxID=103441 RepID=UPI00040105E4|nr:hypothetical protein [Pseudonocardia spinosispora]
MPLLMLEVPTGVHREAKQKMMRTITEAIDGAYHFPDTRIFLRETPAENIAQDGELCDELGAKSVRPVGFLEAPELSSDDAKRTMLVRIHDAIAEAYADVANTEQTLLLINQYPLNDVAWLRQLQSDNAEIVAAVAALNPS